MVGPTVRHAAVLAVAVQLRKSLFSLAACCFLGHTRPLAELKLPDARQRRIGNAYKENVEQTLMTLALYPFIQRLGMTIEALNDLVTRAREDAANPSLKAYFPL